MLRDEARSLHMESATKHALWHHQTFFRSTKLKAKNWPRIPFTRTSFTFSYSPFIKTGGEPVPSEGKVMQSLIGSIIWWVLEQLYRKAGVK